jgi:SAM-dependent methyltransferase
VRSAGASTDAGVLRGAAYATADNLLARASIYGYRTEPLDFVPWVLGQGSWPAGGAALDVGCGPGQYSRAMSDLGMAVTAVDLSEGMVRAASAAGVRGAGVADAQRLPFPDASFDRVVAAHMLYHLPDRTAGAAELARVLRAGGVALVVTNGAGHLGELRSAMGAAGGIGTPVSENFLLDDDGRALLSTAFDEVELIRHVGRIEVPEAAPVLGYAESCRALDEPSMVVPWDEMMTAFAVEVRAEIERTGSFGITTDTGVFRCGAPR